MFQKLYKNLEEINSHGYEQRLELKQTREAIMKLTEQLALSGATVPMTTEATPSKIAKQTMSFQKAGVVILSIGIVLLAILTFLAILSSRNNSRLLQTEAVRLNVVGQDRASFSRVDERQEVLKEKEGILELRISKLDSLLVAEHQSLEELKKLNNTAVRTFIRIRKDMEQRDQPASAVK